MAKRELRENWTFEPSRPSLKRRMVRLYALLTGARAPPDRLTLRPVTPRRRWICYFVYLTDGRLTPAHEFALENLRATDAGLLVICATPVRGEVPKPLLDGADAVYWKGLSGYDHSAYTIALEEVAARSPGADLLLLNDSVYGPFEPLDPFFARAKWDLTGFTASAMFENHIQSYAILLHDITPERVRSLRDVFPRRIAFSRVKDVIHLQETRLARRASARMSVGAFWYAAGAEPWDPALSGAVELLEAGYPFLKTGLFGKAAGKSDKAALLDFLKRHGHPLP